MLTKYVHELDDATFQDSINQAVRLVLVDFWAPWCPPCRALAPTIETIAEQFEGRADVAKLDIDQNPETAAAYGVRSIPAVLIFRGGQIADRISVGTFVTTVTIIRARRGSTAWDPTADTGSSVDTGGQALLQEDRQLFLLSFGEGSGPEHLVHDCEPRAIGDDHRGPDLGVRAVEAFGERTQEVAVQARPEQLGRVRFRGGVQNEQQRYGALVRGVLSPVHHPARQAFGEGCPIAVDEVPDVERALDHFGEKPLLGAEVAVHHCGIHPGVGSDLADPGALVALIREASSGRLEDGRAGRGGIPPALRMHRGWAL
jgi:thioredoxin 1